MIADNDEILVKIKNLVNNDNMGSRIQLIRMYSAFENAQQRHDQIEKFAEYARIKYFQDVVVISDTQAIFTVIDNKFSADKTDQTFYVPVDLEHFSNIYCSSMNEAMVYLVCISKDDYRMAEYIMKMVNAGDDK